MAKGILVFDNVPNNCYNCLLKKKPPGMSFPEDMICLPMCKSIYEYKPNNVNGGKPDWCPIKHIPEKQNNDNLYDEYYNGFDAGWNACIDEILKGEQLWQKIELNLVYITFVQENAKRVEKLIIRVIVRSVRSMCLEQGLSM